MSAAVLCSFLRRQKKTKKKNKPKKKTTTKKNTQKKKKKRLFNSPETMAWLVQTKNFVIGKSLWCNQSFNMLLLLIFYFRTPFLFIGPDFMLKGFWTL